MAVSAKASVAMLGQIADKAAKRMGVGWHVKQTSE